MQRTTAGEDGAIAGVARDAGAQLVDGVTRAVSDHELQHFVRGVVGEGLDRGFLDARADAQRRELGQRQAVGQVGADHVGGEAGAEADHAFGLAEEGGHGLADAVFGEVGIGPAQVQRA